jgi:phenylacetate-CoA ligase
MSSTYVPYYQDLMVKQNLRLTDFRCLDDLQKIPLLTKNILRDSGTSMINTTYSDYDLVANSTSGSTGETTRFYSDRNSYPFNLALHIRQHDWMNIDYFVRQFWIWGASFSVIPKKHNQFVSKLKRRINVSSYHLSSSDVEDIIKRINLYKPYLIGAYPSHLSLIAETAKTRLEHRPRAISLSGEMTYPEQLEQIRDFFHAPVFNYYGARDGSLIAQECEKHTGLHIFAENVIVEILDENNKPVTDGIGRIVLTLLNNYAMPLIRYEIGDLAEVNNDMWSPCPCGRTLPRLSKIIGRTFDIVKFPNGNKVGGTFWTFLLKTEYGVKNFSVFQDKFGTINIKYLRDRGIKVDTNPILQKILEHGGATTQVTFEEVSELDNHTKNGKLRLVSSEYNV